MERAYWTLFLDRLDPSSVSRAGERMGTYPRWCLEGFDAGLKGDDVLSRTGEKYAAHWGEDKVMKLLKEKGYGCRCVKPVPEDGE